MNQQSRYLEVKNRLVRDFELKESGDWLRRGICPDCGKRELYINGVTPYVLKCGRLNHCGYEVTTRELYSDIFENFNKRYQPTASNPSATADAYLEMARGFDIKTMRGWYTQEKYWNPNADRGTASVRFMVDRENDVWFERFVETIKITQDGESKPRNKNFHGAISGKYWRPPTMEFKDGDKVWIVEGILDAIALVQNGIKAIAILSCNNWRKTDFKSHEGITWVVAFDSDKAGKTDAKKLFNHLLDNGLSPLCALLPTKHKKLDWNDAAMMGILSPSDVDQYLYNGKLLTAQTATEKALAIYNHKGNSIFSLDFNNRLYWFELDLEKFNSEYANLLDGNDDIDETDARDSALESSGTLKEIANCKPEFLYFQANTITDESWYYARVDFPHKGVSIKNTFSGSQMSGAGEFKKRLLSIAPGALFTGNNLQLDFIVRNQLHNIKVVKTVDYVGYSKEFKTYIFSKKSVSKGKVFDINDEDYFDVGDHSIKTLQKSIKIEVGHARNYRRDWPQLVKAAFGVKGLVAAAVWTGILFAEQIREKQKSFPFLEIIGEAGAGKTTLVEFLWCLFGRQDEEGFDPSKSTAAAISRKFSQVSNFPVSLIEADRDDSSSVRKKFDWEELKTAYNGRAVRSRGMKTGGNETYEPPFRGGIVITQNNEVDGSDAILQRIVHMHFGRSHHNLESKVAADEMASLGVEQLSHYLILATQNERKIVDHINTSLVSYEALIRDRKTIKTMRIIKNHAQVLAMVDCFCDLVDLDESTKADMHNAVIQMAEQRQEQIGADHPIVARFWEMYDHIGPSRLNHSSKPNVIAINIQQFMGYAAEARLQVPLDSELRNHLKSSKSRKFIKSNHPVSSSIRTLDQGGRTVRCWLFESGES